MTLLPHEIPFTFDKHKNLCSKAFVAVGQVEIYLTFRNCLTPAGLIANPWPLPDAGHALKYAAELQEDSDFFVDKEIVFQALKTWKKKKNENYLSGDYIRGTLPLLFLRTKLAGDRPVSIVKMEKDFKNDTVWLTVFGRWGNNTVNSWRKYNFSAEHLEDEFQKTSFPSGFSSMLCVDQGVDVVSQPALFVDADISL